MKLNAASYGYTGSMRSAEYDHLISLQLGGAPTTTGYQYEHGEPLKDPRCTPGAISPAVTQANLTSTICRKGGYTSGIRPPAYVTGRTCGWGLPTPGHKGFGVNNKKDPVETRLRTAVCKGQVTLAAAQQAIVTDCSTAVTSLHLG